MSLSKSLPLGSSFGISCHIIPVVEIALLNIVRINESEMLFS
jgi:hypothetical protein